MNMQDKEMDELFRSRLGDFEMNPSPKVWDKVSAGLKTDQPKRRIAPWLSVAASVMVLVTAGTLFFNRTTPVNTPVKVHRPIADNANTTFGKPMKSALVAVRRSPAQQLVSVKQALKTGTVQFVKIRHRPNKSKIIPNVPDGAGISIAPEQQQEILAAAEPHQIDVTNPVVPDASLANPSASVDQSTNTTVINTKVARVQSITKSKRQGFRSLGDIVNAVVAKVDKRADKVIEFSDTDDDESTITGLNLGIIKVKKEK